MFLVKKLVIDLCDRKCSNGPIISKLYRLNAIYNGSTALRTESASLRPLLLTEALLTQATGKIFRRQRFGSPLIPARYVSSFIPVYRFVRAPHYFEELELPKYRCLAIWLECGAIVCFSGSSFDRDDKRTLSLNIEHDGDPKYELECVIYGESNESLAKAATFLCSLKEKGDSTRTRLELYAGFAYDTKYTFDFRVFRPEQLAQILQANPKRHFDFRLGNWSPEQSAILATRPFPLNLTFARSEETTRARVSHNGGKAFIDALE
jgi:hypothetical protein